MYVGKLSSRGRLYEGGNERLRYKIELPCFEKCEKINEFYSETLNNCELFCKEKLFGELCGDSVEKEKKRYSYELNFRVTHNDGKTVSLLLKARLACGWECLHECVVAMNWSVTDEYMLPPKLLLSHYREKGQRIKAEEGLFLKDGRLESLHNSGGRVFLSK